MCETKANILVRQYEFFKMEDSEDIEAMLNRFQTLDHGLKMLDKSHTVAGDLRSQLFKWKRN